MRLLKGTPNNLLGHRFQFYTRFDSIEEDATIAALS